MSTWPTLLKKVSNLLFFRQKIGQAPVSKDATKNWPHDRRAAYLSQIDNLQKYTILNKFQNVCLNI